MAYEKNYSGWAKAALDTRIPIKNQYLEEDKLEQLLRLEKSGLPTYQYHRFKIDELEKRASEIHEIYLRYDKNIVVRICPTHKGMQRYKYIGENIEHILNDVKKKIPLKETDKYVMVINEYDPAEYCGIIISSPQGLRIELVQEPNLENMCYGRSIPWSGVGEIEEHNHLRRMNYLNVEDETIRKIMWNAVISICTEKTIEARIYQCPMAGYYEFAISQKTKKLRFIDYNPGKST